VQYRTLGRTGLWVSEISLGAMTFGGASDDPVWGAVGALRIEESERLVDVAIDAGVNLIDTADVYAGGESEEQLGRILQERRDRVLLATKAMVRSGPGPNDLGATRLHLLRSIEASLRRLRADHIDIFQLHNVDPLTPLEETLTALDDAVRQGKIRYVGAANFPAWQVTKAQGISALRQISGFVTLQEHYSLLSRDLEAEILPMVESENIGLTIWGPLAAGYLTGKFDRDGMSSEASARRAKNPAQPGGVCWRWCEWGPSDETPPWRRSPWRGFSPGPPSPASRWAPVRSRSFGTTWRRRTFGSTRTTSRNWMRSARRRRCIPSGRTTTPPPCGVPSRRREVRGPAERAGQRSCSGPWGTRSRLYAARISVTNSSGSSQAA
jgi:aryl-alcohol dehydrogenase-like predicted oxidoreductase